MLKWQFGQKYNRISEFLPENPLFINISVLVSMKNISKKAMVFPKIFLTFVSLIEINYLFEY